MISYITSLPTLIKTLFLFMGIDFIFGLSKGYINKDLSSKKIFKGGVRKGLVFFIIIVSFYLGRLIDFPMARDITTVYYLSMETLSIFEHAIDLDLPLPQFLKDGAERLRDNSNQGGSL